MPKRESPEEAILKRTDRSGECWLWTGKILKPGMGYGLVSQHSGWRLAHRISYLTFVGDIPEGMQVLHRCDVPNCVNPRHLWLGTQRENIHDMMEKKRREFVRDSKGMFKRA